MNNIINLFKENKKLMYAVNIFILLVIISLILKIDTSKIKQDKLNKAIIPSSNAESNVDSYVFTLEKRLEEILSKIDKMDSVEVMIYTKKTPKLEPLIDENTSSEINTQVGGDGIKNQTNRETKKSEVVIKNNNQVVEKVYEYPEISGVLIVAKYVGNKDIYTIMMNSVKTLLDINVNNIEIILSN